MQGYIISSAQQTASDSGRITVQKNAQWKSGSGIGIRIGKEKVDGFLITHICVRKNFSKCRLSELIYYTYACGMEPGFILTLIYYIYMTCNMVVIMVFIILSFWLLSFTELLFTDLLLFYRSESFSMLLIGCRRWFSRCRSFVQLPEKNLSVFQTVEM